jgi:hypothetical protein
MSIRTASVPLVSVLCLVWASPAYAWFGDGWLEKLSGPGPFRGWSGDVRLFCFAARSQSPGTTAIAPDDAAGWHATFPKDPSAGFWFTPLGCHFLDRDQPRLEFGVQYAAMSSDAGDNPLDYSHRPDVSDAEKGVDLSLFLITADVRVNRVLDVGASAGWSTFRSPDDVFPDLPKLAFQPVRVTVRPFSALAARSRFADLLSVRVDATRFNGGFRDEEFGARRGTYNEPGELVWGWRVLVDLGTLFWVD